MRTWTILLVLALCAGLMAQGTTTKPGTVHNPGTPGGSGGISNDYLDKSFGADQKYDFQNDDPVEPEDEGEGDDPEGPETPPEPPEMYGEEYPVEEAFIIFICDISCSMDSQWQTFTDENGNVTSGYRIDRAKSEINGAISGLDEEYLFDIVAYTCSTLTCWGSLKEATTANKVAGQGWVSALTPSGATGTGPAVSYALNNPGYSECMTYILVTDGAPNCLDSGWNYGSPADHLNVISGANGKGATIHVIGISPNYADMVQFCQDVAAQNGPGVYTQVD